MAQATNNNFPLPSDLIGEVLSHLSPAEMAKAEPICRVVRQEALKRWDALSKAKGCRPDGMSAKVHVFGTSVERFAKWINASEVVQLLEKLPELAHGQVVTFCRSELDVLYPEALLIDFSLDRQTGRFSLDLWGLDYHDLQIARLYDDSMMMSAITSLHGCLNSADEAVWVPFENVQTVGSGMVYPPGARKSPMESWMSRSAYEILNEKVGQLLGDGTTIPPQLAQAMIKQ